MNDAKFNRDRYFKPDKIRWTVINGLPCNFTQFAMVYSKKHEEEKVTDVTHERLREKVR